MKKLCLILFFALSISCVQAADFRGMQALTRTAPVFPPGTPPPSQELIRNTLIPQWMVLSYENLENGPIQAKRVEMNSSEHFGEYVGGSIHTFLDIQSGMEEGEQIVYWSNGDSSLSRRCSLETICAETYVVHYHEGFRVFSTHDKQFVVS